MWSDGLKRTWSRWGWPCAVIAAALVPLHGVFTSARIFHVRDLSLFFWPRHLWLRDTLQAGHLPLWDPYPAAGQAAFADPLHQLFFLPSLLLRLLLPEIVGFNLWVALPLPVAATGAYLLFRNRVPASAAALGALIFTYAGPVVSTLLYPNLSWSVALMPWVVWAGQSAAERAGRRTVVAFACAVALQALAGEPVTLAATLLLVVAFASVQVTTPFGRRIARLAVGIGGGLLLAAAQLVPLVLATMGSARAQMQNDGTWSLHPLAAIELVLPSVFGSTYDTSMSDLPWLAGLNGGRDPLFYSLYLGIGALTLMFAAAASPDRRWVRFWGWTAVLAAIAALGEFSGPYRVLQSLVPPVETFRYPVKFLTVGALAAGALAASGCAAIQHPSGARAIGRKRALVTIGAIACIALVIASILLLEGSAQPVAWLAARVGIDDVGAAAAFLRASGPPLLLRLAVLGAAGAGLLAVAASTHRRRGVAAAALCVLAVADPAVANLGLNPTIPAAALREPAWVQTVRTREDGRVYVGARLPDPRDIRYAIDGSRELYTPAELSPIDARTLTQFQYALTPSAWRMREVVSYDLPMLWSKEYTETLRMFSLADAQSRWRFLLRAGVRYCFVGEPLDRWAPAMLQRSGFDSMTLYECNPSARRAFVTESLVIEPNPRERIARLFDAGLAADALLLAEPPPAASGRAGAPGPMAARIIEETPNRVVVRATAGPQGGYLTLLDTFDSDWRVTVDGERAPVLRGNVLFRAVRLAPGDHRVEFRYRPTALYAGAAISLIAMFGLLVPWRRPRRQPVVSHGTLDRAPHERAEDDRHESALV